MIRFKEFLKDEEASGVVELILIVAVLVMLIALFKDRIGKIIDKMLTQIDSDAGKIEGGLSGK